MEVVHRVCCGLDVHRDTVVAWLLRAAVTGDGGKEVRTFRTTTEGLAALGAWLVEATGVYWKPEFNVLESCAQVLVANAVHIRGMPGWKTDVQDAQWIAELFQHGLIRPSFIPERFQREVGDRTRTRTTLIDERSAVVNRLPEVLEDANLKLSGVASDILGVSGRAMIEAILAGTSDPVELAGLAKGRLRQKREVLARALTGQVNDHHRMLLALHLAHIDFLNDSITQWSAEIA
ncbi:MAG: transposase, partial [Chloroflexi bacterium]|nr:transposase [Chloroflexota bacterium]